MKNLNITMTVKANSVNNAESIAMRELMNLAKAVSFMGSGSGNATHISDCMYEVKATVSVASEINDTNIANTMMNTFMKSPDIISSFVYIGSEEKRNETTKVHTVQCERCGQIAVPEALNKVNPNMDSEHYLCDDCLKICIKNESVYRCDVCLSYISETELVTNPVTTANTICPCCGENI